MSANKQNSVFKSSDEIEISSQNPVLQNKQQQSYHEAALHPQKSSLSHTEFPLSAKHSEHK